MRATNPGFVPDSPFTRPLPEAWTDFFSRFPKAELHCHLLGTITKSTFEDLVRLSGAPVTQEEIDGFFTRGDKPVGVLRIFRALEAHILSRPEFLERIAYEHTVAVSRLMLDNIPHIKAYWIMMGTKLAQTALWYGADDLDGTVVEEHIGHMAGAGSAQGLTLKDLEFMIREAGFTPVRRNAIFNTVQTEEARA